MEILNCLQCKGEILLSDDGRIGKCRACGAVFHFKNEKNSRLIALLNQANISRLRGDYDGAILAYQIALKEDETDADAYWGLTLSVFGIEYVEDQRTNRFIPTCRRTIKHSILEDENYLNAIKYASPEQAEQFEKSAKEIDRLQTAIKDKIKDEQEFDVFLCFKSSDENGNPTPDRYIARNIYGELEKRGIRTFFSEISLKDRLGEDYEPIIYKAIYTCKIFILIATSSEYIQASWLKNEWSRFRDRTVDEGLDNVAFAVFRDVKPNELPAIFRSQGVNLEKYPAGGYEIEIADNLEVRLKQKKFNSLDDRVEAIIRENSAYVIEDKVVDLVDKKLKSTRETAEEKIDRANAYYEIGNKQKALELLNETIDQYPRKAMAWYTKAKILTDNFTINIMEFHLNEELKKDFTYNLTNANRFATQEEQVLIEKETKVFYDDISLLGKTDEIVSDYESRIEDFSVIKGELEKLHEELKDVRLKSKIGLTDAINLNNAEIKEVRKHLTFKSYYTKNIQFTSSWLFGFLNFVSVLVVLTAVIGTLITTSRALNFNLPITKSIMEGLFLATVGLTPALLSYFLRRNKKIAKVSDIIDKDRKKLQTLKEENERLKKEIERFDLEVANKKEDLVLRRANLLSKLDQIKNVLISLHTEMNNICQGKDFVKSYLEKYHSFSEEEVNKQNLEIKADIKNLNAERDTLVNSNLAKLNTLQIQKPKYYSLKYDKLVEKTNLLIEQNEKRIFYIDEELERLGMVLKSLELKKEKTFLDSFAFESFITQIDGLAESERQLDEQEKTEIEKEKERVKEVKEKEAKVIEEDEIVILPTDIKPKQKELTKKIQKQTKEKVVEPKEKKD